MTITLDLTTEEEARLKAKAERAGVEPDDLLRQFIRSEDKILADTQPDSSYRDSWTDQDMLDFTAASMHRLDQQLGEEGEYNNA